MTQKKYLIVGGSKGIGLGIVKRLHQAGHETTVFSRSRGDLPESLDVTHRCFDVTSDELTKDDIPQGLSGLAYCPGSINLRSFRALKPEIFREDFELNLIGAVRVLQAAMGQFVDQPDPASILLFSTVAVGQGMFAHASIAAAKGAIEGLTKTLAAEMAPKVRVNCIAPALTETPMTARFFSDSEKAKTMGDKYPLGRTGTVDDIADLAEFLLSARSNWITGQTIGVDGGISTLRK